MPTSPEPIAVFTTGGTIDKLYFDALSEYQIGESIASKLLSVARVNYPYRIVEILRKDSLDLNEADRQALAAYVSQDPSKRIVVTHGTDTMSQSAQALATLSDKTIVLTGALTPARFTESDAAFNLGMAFAVAQTAAPGVYVTMNGEVFRGSEVVKDRANARFIRPDSR